MSRIAFSFAALACLLFVPAQSFANEPAASKQETKKAAAPVKKEETKQPAKAATAATIELETSEGKIRIALDAEKAPVTAKNFLDYVEAKHYDGTVFHRVIDGFMIQGGGYNIDGGQLSEKKTNPPISNEAKNGLKNDRGTIAMARTSDPNSATAQFFINHVDNNGLNFPSPDGHGYAVFGKVVDGMDVVDKIAKTKTAMKYGMADVPEKEVKIISAKVVK